MCMRSSLTNFPFEYRTDSSAGSFALFASCCILSFFMAAAVSLVRFQGGAWGFGFEGVSLRLTNVSGSLLLMGLLALSILWALLVLRCGLMHIFRKIGRSDPKYRAALILIFVLFLFSAVRFHKFGLNLPPPTARFFAISFRNFLIHAFWVTGVLLAAGLLFQRLPVNTRELLDRVRFRAFATFGKPLPVFLWIVVATNFFAWFLFRHVPSVADEISLLFQSRVFASGHLYLDPPAHVEFFRLDHIMDQGRWYSVYPPGHPAMLTLGELIGTPWLINPLAAALSAVVIYRLGKETYGEKTAGLGALLAGLSPFLLFMSASYMSHPTALLFSALFLLTAARCMNRMSPLAGLAAGLFIGMVFLIRPLTAVGLGLPAALWLTFMLVRRPGRAARTAIAALLGFSALAALFLLYNWALTGDALTMGYIARFGPEQSMGFGPRSWGVVHTPWRGLMNIAANVQGLNEFLFQWPVPSLAFIFIAAAYRRRNPWDAFFFAPIVSIMTLYFFYFGQDLHLGPRYFFEMIPCLCILTARGIRVVPALLRDLRFRTAAARAREFVLFLLLISVVFAFTHRVPLWIEHYSRFLNPRIAREAQERDLHNALIFVEPGFRGWSGMFWDSLRLDDDVLFARDLGSRNAVLRGLYPRKECYRVVWNSANDRISWRRCEEQ